MKRRLWRRRKQLLDDLKTMRRYWNLKREAVDGIQRKIRCGRDMDLS
jgi:hypothetical protein